MQRRIGGVLATLCVFAGASPAAPSGAAPSYPNGLLVALAQFQVGADGQATATPGPAKLLLLAYRDGGWTSATLEDPDSNVFHKALPYTLPGTPAGILTLGGNAAAVKLWRAGANGFAADTLWRASFGGTHNRMRDGEVGDLYGDGRPDVAIATHDQGVVAVVRPGQDVIELDRKPRTFVHEIEIGDLDRDGTREVYATPSEPNRLDGTPQPGRVVRYVPARREGPAVVVDLGTRHAKEILVTDLDGDRRDELFVAVEAETTGAGATLRVERPVEIRRYEWRDGALAGTTIATLDDRFCRFLTAGDLDGDGKRELVAAAFRSGVWWLRPATESGAPWRVDSIDRDSGGFEHAALVTDLDGDGRDELYVASDDHGEIRQYRWTGTRLARETIFRHPVPKAVITWNITAAPAAPFAGSR